MQSEDAILKNIESRSIKNKCCDRINRCDIAAVLLGVCLLVFFLITARYGVGMPDEAFYYTIPQRLLNGDRLFVDEWHLTQLASLFSVLPYWIFTTITGSTEGLILYMRCFFTGINMLFYAYLYYKLRSYGIWGLLSAFLFCAILPEVNYAISYFTVSSMAMMVVCIIFFTEPEPGIPKSIAAGVFFAFSVVAEPLLFFLYFIYTAAVVICRFRKQKNACGGFLGLRVWFFFSVGGFAVLAALLVFLFKTGSLQALEKTLPYLFSGKEFNESNFFDPSRLKSVYRFFGAVSQIFFAASIGIFLFCAVFRKMSDRMRILIFILSCVSFAVSCIMGFRSVLNGKEGSNSIQYFVLYHDLPILLIVPIWYFLCKKKDPRLFAFWVCGVLYSVLVDISSDVIIGSGGRIAQTAGFLLLAELAPELKALFQNESEKGAYAFLSIDALKKAFTAFCTVCFVVFTAWNVVYIGLEGFYQPIEKMYCDDGTAWPYYVKLTEGPFKNLKTNKKVSKVYLATLRDLDSIVKEAQDERFITFGLNPYVYLYVDLPYACFSAWDQNTVDRSLVYWQLLEDRKPSYIYYSYYPFVYWKVILNQKDNIEVLESQLGKCDVTAGEAGYIIKVLERINIF